MFAGVGLTGLVVNTVAFWLLVRFGHLHYLAAAAVATQVSTTWNFIGMEAIVFSDRRSGGLLGRYLRFCVLNNTVMLARLPFLAFLVTVVHVPQLLANVVTLLAVFLVRFGVSDRFIYEARREENGARTVPRARWWGRSRLRSKESPGAGQGPSRRW